MLALVGVWFKGLGARQGTALQSTYPGEAGGEQAAKANSVSCCLWIWKDNKMKHQRSFPRADEMHTLSCAQGASLSPRKLLPLAQPSARISL